MLHFEGTRDFKQAPAALCGKLSDASFLVTCIPGAEGVSGAERDRAAFRIRPGFAFVRGTLDVVLAVVEAVEPTSAKFSVRSKGIGSSADVEGTLALAPFGDGTRVQWAADVVNLGGLLKAVPQGLIRGADEKVINDMWEAVAARLNAE
jgi:carbon monoxide dehydrogenase subunit G